MKKVLVGTFYILQGIGNFIFGLYIRVDGSPGAPGGVLAGMEIMARTFLVVVSCLSFMTGLILFLQLQDWALPLGIITSVFIILFYVSMAIFLFVLPLLLLSVIVVLLNVVSIFFLNKLTKS